MHCEGKALSPLFKMKLNIKEQPYKHCIPGSQLASCMHIV